MRLPPLLLRALDDTGQPWRLENGGSHYKLIVAGRLAGVLSRSPAGTPRHSLLNTRAQIRRIARDVAKEHTT